MDAVRRRWNAEELLRRRRSDDVRRFVASQRSGRIDANPHQLDAVLFALARIPEGGCILADEVGLGKTIEAGLVIAQLLAEGARRILLVTPKPLVGQWREELHRLFDMPVLEGRDGFLGDGVFIVGRESAASEDVAGALAAEPFDLVVVDEAHEIFAGLYRRYDADGEYKPDSKHAKTAGAIKEAIGDAPVLLLTATPIQNSLTELWGLVQFVDPEGTLLGDLPTFRRVFTDGDDRRLAVGTADELRERIEAVLHRTLRRHAQEFMRRPFVGRSARTFEYRMSVEERALYDDVTRYLMSPGVAAFRGSHRTLLLLGFHRRMASSKAALAASLRNVETRLERMIRAAKAGRDEPGDETANKFAEDFDDVEEEVEWEERDEGTVDATKLERELARVTKLRERAESLDEDGKARALIDAVRARLDQDDVSKVVVFTESLTTQQYIHDTLIDSGVVLPHEVTLFRGTNDSKRALEALRRWQKEVESRMSERERPSRQVAVRLALVHEFRTSSRVLISTEAGAKGLNLQFADTLINYDLPWNPQRIEQRIGRCHRYGQTRDVTVINFLAKDNAAQRLTYEILGQKLELFGTVLGASDQVLHSGSVPVLPALGAHFEKEISEIYRQARSMEEIEERLRALRDSAEERKQRFEAEHARTTRLIEHRLDETVQRTFRSLQKTLPEALRELDEDIERVVQAYLDAIDAPYERRERKGYVQLDIGTSSALPLSCQRASFTIGTPREDAEPVHLGHPLVRAALHEARESSTQVRGLRVKGEGRRGRFALVKIRYPGLDTEEQVHALAFEERAGALVPIDPKTFLDDVLGDSPSLGEVGDSPSAPSAVGDEPVAPSVRDAIEELVFREQHQVAERRAPKLERRLRRIERFLEDRMLVLRRDRSAMQRRVLQAEHARDRAIGADARSTADAKLKRAAERLEHLDARLEQLRAREDDTYQRHRDHLLDRCFTPPSVEVLIDVPWSTTSPARPRRSGAEEGHTDRRG